MAASLVPSWEFLGGNCVEILTSVHSSSEGGGLERAAADVEAPGHQGTDLVGVEVTVDVSGHACVEFAKVLLKKLIGSGLSNGEASVNIGASVAVADGPDTH